MANFMSVGESQTVFLSLIHINAVIDTYVLKITGQKTVYVDLRLEPQYGNGQYSKLQFDNLYNGDGKYAGKLDITLPEFIGLFSYIIKFETRRMNEADKLPLH